MTFQNYFYNTDESGNFKSYEELLLLDYDNYLDNGCINDFSQSKQSDILDYSTKDNI